MDMDKDIAFMLTQWAVYSIALPLLVALFRFILSILSRSCKFNWEQKILSYLVLLSLFVEILAQVLALHFNIVNLFLLHIFTVFEFALIALIYRKKLQPIIKQHWMTILIVIYVIFAIVNVLVNEKLTEFNSFAKAVEGLIVIVMTLIYFYKIMTEIKIKRLEREPMFWLNTGFLLYFSASLFIFIFGNYIEPSLKLSFTFWGIHAILTIIKNIFFAITLWINPQKIA